MTDTQRYNTGNDLRSNKLEDLSDNAKNIDNFSNSGNETFTDRLGISRRTIAGMESDHDNQISAHEIEHDNQISAHETEHDNQIARHESEFITHIEGMGWTPAAGSFQTGATITARNQCLQDTSTGIFYSWNGVLPKIVPAGSTPATDGGVGVGLWSDKTDLMLRNELSSQNGAYLVGNATFYIEDVLSADVTNIPDNAIVIAMSRDGDEAGGGVFMYSSSSVDAIDNGIIFQPTTGGGRLLRVMDSDNVYPEYFGAKGDNSVDDCVGWRLAVSYIKTNGGGTLSTTHKNFYFKTYMALATYIPAIVWQNDPCVIFDGCNDFVFNCGGSKVYVSGAAADAHPNGSGHCIFGFNNCNNLKGDLPEIVGNRGNIPANKFNLGLFFESCIGINLSVLKFSGDFDGGSNFAGGHIFDANIEKIITENTSIVVDTTCLENFTIGEIITSNPASLFSSVFSCFYDAPSFAYNVSGRTLKKLMSSNVHVGRIVAHGANSAVFLDCVDGFEAYISQVGGLRCASITTSDGTNSLRLTTRNIRISGDIQDLTDSAGMFTLTTHGITNVKFDNFNVKNCRGYAISATSVVGLDGVSISNSDWSGQTLKIDPTLAQAIGASNGVMSGIKGYTPRLNAVQTNLPSLTGSTNKVYNRWPFPVQVIINTTGLDYVTHITEPDGTDINLGIQTAEAPLTIILASNEAIWFEANLPTYWMWRGM